MDLYLALTCLTPPFCSKPTLTLCISYTHFTHPQALMSEKLSVDSLFLMSHSSLMQLFANHDISQIDSQKLVELLGLLGDYYGKL